MLPASSPLRLLLLVASSALGVFAGGRLLPHSGARSTPSLGVTTSAAALISAPADVLAPGPEAKIHPSGVAIRVLKPGRPGATPGDDDRVTVHYTTWKRDGTLVDSSRRRGTPTVQTVRRLLPGLAEAVREMTVGEQCRVWVPAKLTYVDDDNQTPPGDLTIDLELLDLLLAPKPPAMLTAAPESATCTASGLCYEVLEPGERGTAPGPTSSVSYYHSAWTSEGNLFESSLMARQPMRAKMPALIRGLQEGFRFIGVGGQARLWIPPRLAYGERPRRGAPKGLLTYEVELLSVDDAARAVSSSN